MSPKKIVTDAIFLLTISCFLIAGCSKKEKRWSVAMCRPAFYVSGGQQVAYFYKGQYLGGAGSTTDIGEFGRAYPGERNFASSLIPDSLSVSYSGLDKQGKTYLFSGGTSLPTEAIRHVFGEEDSDSPVILTGFAPGGRICVWANNIEIKRAIVPQRDKLYDFPFISSKRDSLGIYAYLKTHPVNYSFWEKSDPAYELDFKFYSENGLHEIVFLELFSKEGIRNQISYSSFEKTLRNIPLEIRQTKKPIQRIPEREKLKLL